MKKISIIILALLGCVVSNAQSNWYEAGEAFEVFFDTNLGVVATNEVTTTMPTTIAIEKSRPQIIHRKDDIVWSRVVYRIVDLRLKQNYQLYTPVVADDPLYASLFRTILRAIEGDAPIYKKSSQAADLKPYFNASTIIPKQDIPSLFLNHITQDDMDLMSDQEKEDASVLKYDAATDKLVFNNYPYKNYAKNVLKYIVQEVVFYDKHYSRLFTKIVAIAPMCAGNLQDLPQNATVVESVYKQVLFWVPFEILRPFLAAQPVTPLSNDKEGNMNYAEFFDKKMYSSYILGDNNQFSRMVPEKAGAAYQDALDKASAITDPAEKDKALEAAKKKYYQDIQKEQQEIEHELLMTEQNLWEY
jgi:gliding motility associated protien GldN